MNRRSVLSWLAAIVMVIMINGLGGVLANRNTTSSDGRNLWWERFDVRIDQMDTTANQFDVTETYELNIERGPYSYGFRELPLDRVTGIGDVQVSQDGQPLRAACTRSPGTFCKEVKPNTARVVYYFLQPAQSGDQPQIEIRYTVIGALRAYDKGDELFWAALPEDLAGFDVLASRVQVVLPAGTNILAATSYPDTWYQTIEENTLVWTSPPRPSDDGLAEIRVKFPHNPAMPKPSWQSGYDRRVRYEDHLQPLVSLVLAVGAVLFGLLGSLWIVVCFLREGRDPATIVVPEYLAEPPGDDTPGLVGLLIDEKADMRDVMATFVDLARRGYFVIEQSQETHLGVFKSTDFRFHRTEKSRDGLAGYEQTLLEGLFKGGSTETDLDDLKTKFYTRIPGIKQSLYNELVNAGYFTRSPQVTRTYWILGGIALLVLGSAGFWVGRTALLSSISPLMMLPPISLGIVGAVALLFSNAMPAKTAQGAQRAALWRAFKRYLENIDKRPDAAIAAEHFDQYMPYAVAFGLEDEFVKHIAPQLTAMPAWYFPTYLGGPWHGGYRSGTHPTGVPGGGFSLGGPGGLSGLDSSLSEGLNAMSRGMTQMLNDASRVMTSRPESSGSGGRSGGGFSGGGAGGGSGGGSAGFG